MSGMRWDDERWIKLYVRDTPGWVIVPWEARAVLPLVLRKLDRAGILELGDEGLEALAALILMPLEVVTVGVTAWLKRGTLEMRGTTLVMPNFVVAQEARASNALRCRESRARARDSLRATQNASPATQNASQPTHDETARHAVTHDDTIRGEESRGEENRREEKEPTASQQSFGLTPKEPSPGTYSAGAHGRIHEVFVESFTRAKGVAPVKFSKAHYTAIAELLKVYGEGEAIEIIRRAFQDAFVADKNATLRFIVSKADTFRGKAHANGTTARNPVQATPATGRVWKMAGE